MFFIRALDGDEPAMTEAQDPPSYLSLDGRIWKGVSVSQSGKRWIAVEFRKNSSVLRELRDALDTIANDTNRTGLLVRIKAHDDKLTVAADLFCPWVNIQRLFLCKVYNAVNVATVVLSRPNALKYLAITESLLPDDAGSEFLRFMSSKQLHTPVGLKRFCISMPTTPDEPFLRHTSNPSPWLAATHFMPNLRRLYLSCGLVSTFTGTLPDTLDLKSLELPRCRLGGGVLALLPAIRSYRRLSMISLASNKIGYNDLVQLLVALRMSPNLKMLNLSHNDFGDRGVQQIINDPLARSLESLILDTVEMTKLGAGMLLNAIEAGYPLSTLDLGDNKITHPAHVALLQAAKTSPFVRALRTEFGLTTVKPMGNPILFKIVYRLAGERRRRALESRSRIAMLPAELLHKVFAYVIKDTWTFKAPAWLPFEPRDEESRFRRALGRAFPY